MSLKFRVLDERNDKTIVDIGEFAFYSGENRKMRLQIFESYDNKPRFAKSGATISFNLFASPVDIIKAGIIQEDRSVVEVELTELDTSAMISGNLVAEITEDSTKRVIKSVGVVRKLSRVND